jgi:hypothetical protein
MCWELRGERKGRGVFQRWDVTVCGDRPDIDGRLGRARVCR